MASVKAIGALPSAIGSSTTLHSTLPSLRTRRRADLRCFPGDVRMGALRHKQEEIPLLRADQIRNNVVQMGELVDVVRAAFPCPMQPDDQRILLAHLIRLRNVKPEADRVFCTFPRCNAKPCCERAEPLPDALSRRPCSIQGASLAIASSCSNVSFCGESVGG